MKTTELKNRLKDNREILTFTNEYFDLPALPTDFHELGESKHWILEPAGNRHDKSHLNKKVLNDILGEDSRFINLIIDGEYFGLYTIKKYKLNPKNILYVTGNWKLKEDFEEWKPKSKYSKL